MSRAVSWREHIPRGVVAETRAASWRELDPARIKEKRKKFQPKFDPAPVRGWNRCKGSLHRFQPRTCLARPFFSTSREDETEAKLWPIFSPAAPRAASPAARWPAPAVAAAAAPPARPRRPPARAAPAVARRPPAPSPRPRAAASPPARRARAPAAASPPAPRALLLGLLRARRRRPHHSGRAPARRLSAPPPAPPLRRAPAKFAYDAAPPRPGARTVLEEMQMGEVRDWAPPGWHGGVIFRGAHLAESGPVVDPDILWWRSYGPRSFQREPAPPEEVAQRIEAEDQHVRRYMKLMVNFTFPEPADSDSDNKRPDPEDPELNSIQRRVKKWARKKMATQFNDYKKKLDNSFIKKKKTPDFKGPYEKIKDHWEAFVKYKTSERAKTRSDTNKKNAANKMYFHTMGRGGYKAGRPKWEKWENDLIKNGIQPEMPSDLYPVDFITESTPCELHFQTMGYLTLKAAIGYVLPPVPDQRYHFKPVPPGYAVAGVDQVMDGYGPPRLDHPAGEGDLLELGEAKNTTVLWRKEFIVIPGWKAPTRSPPSQHSPPMQPSPVSLPRRRVSHLRRA
ncbi:hypothetical protein QYE76_047175 [Lolium multiflorum]|uniref:DUF8039 domain-containing protein n=1 Tax=Lolium multiflorum TaxID=4521 RepID=A0AAD8WZ15_LOLMU|nr:hypothetical protein QYE76_047175 [Lolium multiflorum]